MFRPLTSEDSILHSKPFTDEEVVFNLLHLISGFEGALRLRTDDGRAMFAQTLGHNGWLWMSRDAGNEERQRIVAGLCEHIGDRALPGVCGEASAVELFAETYSRLAGKTYRRHMAMQAYQCRQAVHPQQVAGAMRQATEADEETVAGFLADFALGAYGHVVDVGSQMPAARSMASSGNLILWTVDGHPVSMANIAHRSPRHARINGVVTPPAYRKNGYASAVVAGICEMLHRENLIPMLYADMVNPDSNKVYRNIGFIASGEVIDLKFG